MTPILKYVVAFATGLCVGSIGVYIFEEKKLDEATKKVIQDADDYIEERLREIDSNNSENKTEMTAPEEFQTDVRDDSGAYNKRLKREISYTSYFKSDKKNELGELKELTRKEEVETQLAEEGSPEDDEELEEIDLIPAEYFFEDDEYGKVDLLYYASDDTFANMQDDIISDPKKYLGDCINWFKEQRKNGYVRNHKMQIDFEVECINGSYREIVIGEMD